MRGFAADTAKSRQAILAIAGGNPANALNI
jgi:hypothetical protein